MLDLAVIGVVALFAVLGALSGLLLQALRLVAVAVAAVAALELADPLAARLPGLLAAHPAVREAAFPVAIFAVVYLVLSIVARLVAGLLHRTSTSITLADRILGALAGLAKGLVLAYFLVAVLLAAEQRAGGAGFERLDTQGSVAASLVRAWPIERVLPEGLHDG